MKKFFVVFGLLVLALWAAESIINAPQKREAEERAREEARVQDSLAVIQAYRDSINQAARDSLFLVGLERDLPKTRRGDHFSDVNAKGFFVTIEFEKSNAIKAKNLGADDLAKKHLEALSHSLKKAFPEFREKFAEGLDEQLWEEDIDVHSSGKGNRILTFTGATFAANRNIKEYQTGLVKLFRRWRFKEIRYRWAKYQDYTYYELSPDPDSKIPVPESAK